MQMDVWFEVGCAYYPWSPMEQRQVLSWPFMRLENPEKAGGGGGTICSPMSVVCLQLTLLLLLGGVWWLWFCWSCPWGWLLGWWLWGSCVSIEFCQRSDLRKAIPKGPGLYCSASCTIVYLLHSNQSIHSCQYIPNEGELWPLPLTKITFFNSSINNNYFQNSRPVLKIFLSVDPNYLLKLPAYLSYIP